LTPKLSIIREGENCFKLTRVKRAAFLIDASSYFRAFAASVERATHSILIFSWDIDSRIQLLPDNGEASSRYQLSKLLHEVVSKRRSLHVYILNWDFAMVYALERELFPIIKFNRTNHRRIHFRLDGQHPVGASHHRKIVVVDDKLAYVGGIDLTRMRWDTPEHLPNDPRRVDPLGRAYRPFHDVQMAVDGEAAERLGQMFRDRWEVVTGESLAPPEKGEKDPWPSFLRPDVEDVPVAIARTEPGDGVSSPVREVEALCLDGIAAARSHIYIESQFLTSSSIERALSARLKERDCPEILIVLPLRPSNWLENSTLGILQKRLIERLRMGDEFKRLRFVYPVVPGLGEGEYLNLHSKVMVVDDALALVGSSNFTNRSMGVDSECDLAIEAHGNPRIAEVLPVFVTASWANIWAPLLNRSQK
jgi:phospholipase D1/2